MSLVRSLAIFSIRFMSAGRLSRPLRSRIPQALPGDRPEARLAAQITTLLREHGDRFPALAATMTFAATEGPQEQAFTFGLDRVLDGLQLLIAQRRKHTT
jgi:hypothetical protein